MAKVENIINHRGNRAVNQFAITTDKGVYFQSYESVVAFWDNENRMLYVTPLWDCSNTTRKHFYIFLNDYTTFPPYWNRNIVLEMIKLGTITVVKDGELNF